MRSIVIIAAIVLAQACPPSGASPDGAPLEDPGVAPTSEEPTRPTLAEPWATHLATLADPARPHAERFAAVLAFADGPPEAAPALADLLPDGGARYYAVRALGELGDPAADDALREVLADRAWGPRRYAALALGQIGSNKPETGRALELALDDQPAVRDDALLALTQLDPIAGGPPLVRFWTQGLSTGLEVRIEPLQDAALSLDRPVRLEVRLTNRTDHDLVLPPQSRILCRGLYLMDAAGRTPHPRPFEEDSGRRPVTLDETILQPGAAVIVSLPITLERWDRGLPLDHELRPAPPRWALVVGANRYLMHPDASGDLTVRLVWHPAFVSDLVATVARKDAFWTGKAASEPFALTLPPLEQP